MEKPEEKRSLSLGRRTPVCGGEKGAPGTITVWNLCGRRGRRRMKGLWRCGGVEVWRCGGVK
ncbi:hypothetical protein DEO72_LG8g2247 [Vigna unguiculata]|uniref:Uncharacterized protein n=1 Tax=Vigna unguiculata TaxID=3917 RepID=A0A4D6MTX9_VIGUN|nr:hypothetical protein DEO72_LG8g2247 [Vigna unguiculata]